MIIVRKKNLRESDHRRDWSLEIETRDDELRKWDEEESSWRIANDFDY